MSDIHVVPESLRQAGSRIREAGDHVKRVASSAHPIAAGAGGAPSATAASLHVFHSKWSTGVAHLGDSLSGLGIGTDAAADLYEQTDAAVVPDA
jgi:hypothetical protein